MDLDLKRVLEAKPGEPEEVTLTQLTTTWGDELDQDHVLDEYPRPKMRRAAWTCLNGMWEYAIVESSKASELWRTARPPLVWDGSILVPFSPEASLSGVGRQLLPTQLLWYGRDVEVGDLGSSRLLLHFGAVDYACCCYLNGACVGEHVGGYLPFCWDITDLVHPGANRLELCVYDPSEQGTQLRGKQRLRRGNMWYTAQSGIWQTVWMEEVPVTRVVELGMEPNADDGDLLVRTLVSEPGNVLAVDVFDAEDNLVASADVTVEDRTSKLHLRVPSPHLWDTQDPYLYGVRVSYGRDVVRSYCAFRTVCVQEDQDGVPRLHLNHKPLFVRGLLDQGYWPDGLMTPPSDEAMLFDIQTARSLGFNLLRKHIKVEPQRWYWHCDRLGMLVFQDMVSGGGIPGEWTSANIPTLFRFSWSHRGDTSKRSWRLYGADDPAYQREWETTARATIELLREHPCICTWVVFNESWGQFCSEAKTEELRAVDGTRPFVATSGWYDQGAGDFVAVHNYFRSMRVYRDPHGGICGSSGRAFIIDEFGGLTYPVEGHVSVPTTYGYDTYEDAESWREALHALLSEVDALEQDGLAGFVYTQISDVEEETNGLLTYDRRVCKLES